MATYICLKHCSRLQYTQFLAALLKNMVFKMRFKLKLWRELTKCSRGDLDKRMATFTQQPMRTKRHNFHLFTFAELNQIYVRQFPKRLHFLNAHVAFI